MFFSQGCGSKERLKDNLERAIAEEEIEAEVSYREVSVQEAERLGIGGSPTVWVNVGISCLELHPEEFLEEPTATKPGASTMSLPSK